MAIPAFFKILSEAKKYKGAAEGDISSVASVAGVGKFNPDKRIEPGKEVTKEAQQKFDPDKRIDVDKQDIVSTNDSPNASAQKYDPDKRIDVDDKPRSSDGERNPEQEKRTFSESNDIPDDEMPEVEFYTDLDDRVSFASYSDGTWSGEPGKSDFTPNDPKVRDTLANKGESSIKYDNNGEPDFHPISEATVEIENMTADRYSYFDENGVRHEGNFEKADKKLAEQWNAECKDNRSDWTTKEVKDWVKDNNLTRHECLDKKTVEYVDSGTHGECKHYGGVAECKARDNSNVGGNFDV